MWSGSCRVSPSVWLCPCPSARKFLLVLLEAWEPLLHYWGLPYCAGGLAQPFGCMQGHDLGRQRLTPPSGTHSWGCWAAGPLSLNLPGKHKPTFGQGWGYSRTSSVNLLQDLTPGSVEEAEEAEPDEEFKDAIEV